MVFALAPHRRKLCRTFYELQCRSLNHLQCQIRRKSITSAIKTGLSREGKPRERSFHQSGTDPARDRSRGSYDDKPRRRDDDRPSRFSKPDRPFERTDTGRSGGEGDRAFKPYGRRDIGRSGGPFDRAEWPSFKRDDGNFGDALERVDGKDSSRSGASFDRSGRGGRSYDRDNKPFRREDRGSFASEAYQNRSKEFQRDDKPFGRREGGVRSFDRRNDGRDKKPFERRERTDKPYERRERSYDRSDKPFERRERSFDRSDKSFEKRERSSDRSKKPYEWREESDRSSRLWDGPEGSSRKPFETRSSYGKEDRSGRRKYDDDVKDGNLRRKKYQDDESSMPWMEGPRKIDSEREARPRATSSRRHNGERRDSDDVFDAEEYQVPKNLGDVKILIAADSCTHKQFEIGSALLNNDLNDLRAEFERLPAGEESTTLRQKKLKQIAYHEHLFRDLEAKWLDAVPRPEKEDLLPEFKLEKEQRVIELISTLPVNHEQKKLYMCVRDAQVKRRIKQTRIPVELPPRVLPGQVPAVVAEAVQVLRELSEKLPEEDVNKKSYERKIKSFAHLGDGTDDRPGIVKRKNSGDEAGKVEAEPDIDRSAGKPAISLQPDEPEATEESVSMRDEDEDTDNISIPYSTAASTFLYGTNVVLAALRSQRRKIYRLYTHEHSSADDRTSIGRILALATKASIPIEFRTESKMLDKMSDSRPHNGVVLEASSIPTPPVLAISAPEAATGVIPLVLENQSPEDLAINGSPETIPCSTRDRQPLVVLLDGITDEGNIGNILRSAHFYGVDAVAVAINTCAPLTSAPLAKASSGACEAIPILSVSRPASFVLEAAKAGWRIYAAVAPAARNGEIKPPHVKRVSTSTLGNPLEKKPALLMLGAEGEGLRTNLTGKADFWLSIEQARMRSGVDVDANVDVGVESLNVGTAAGVLMERFLRVEK